MARLYDPCLTANRASALPFVLTQESNEGGGGLVSVHQIRVALHPTNHPCSLRIRLPAEVPTHGCPLHAEWLCQAGILVQRGKGELRARQPAGMLQFLVGTGQRRAAVFLVVGLCEHVTLRLFPRRPERSFALPIARSIKRQLPSNLSRACKMSWHDGVAMCPTPQTLSRVGCAKKSPKLRPSCLWCHP